MGPGFRHHNPYFRGDAEFRRRAMEENAAENPRKSLDVKLALEDGNLVAILFHVKQHAEDLGGAMVHVFRFQEKRIVELWDVGQEIPEDSPNENGMF